MWSGNLFQNSGDAWRKQRFPYDAVQTYVETRFYLEHERRLRMGLYS